MSVDLQGITNKNLVAVNEHTPFLEALALMREKRFRHLPVINDNGNLIGIVSRKDLASFGRSPPRTVTDLMSYPLVTANEKDTLKSAIYKFLEKKISSLIIVDDEKRAVGILTTDDILWHLAQTLKDDVKASKPLLNFANLQLVGEVVNELSTMGI
jgi:acetoin utilization protein AcuB